MNIYPNKLLCPVTTSVQSLQLRIAGGHPKSSGAIDMMLGVLRARPHFLTNFQISEMGYMMLPTSEFSGKI